LTQLAGRRRAKVHTVLGPCGAARAGTAKPERGGGEWVDETKPPDANRVNGQ